MILNNGEKIVEEMGVANAHPAGKKPFARPDYIKKFKTLTEGIITPAESERFITLVQDLPNLKAAQLLELNVQLDPKTIARNDKKGIFA